MANHDALLQEWVKKAQGYLPEHLAYRKDPKKGEEIYTVTYKGKKWRLLYSDLEQLASDLNIFDKMYPSTSAAPTEKSFMAAIFSTVTVSYKDFHIDAIILRRHGDYVAFMACQDRIIIADWKGGIGWVLRKSIFDLLSITP